MPLKIPFQFTDWSTVEAVLVPGSTGEARMRTLEQGDLRIRMAEYSAGYLLDHWCTIGHLVLVLEGELITELKDGPTTVMGKGTSFIVSDGLSAHRIRTVGPAKVLIVDGGFLR